MYIHIRHMHKVVLVDNGQLLVVELLPRPPVQLLDNGHQLRHRLLQIVHGPLLQGLGQYCMVGICAGLRHDGDGLVHMNPIFQHEPYELWDYHGGVGVVYLHHRVLIEIPKGISLPRQLLDDKLGRVAHHEILLVHP